MIITAPGLTRASGLGTTHLSSSLSPSSCFTSWRYSFRSSDSSRGSLSREMTCRFTVRVGNSSIHAGMIHQPSTFSICAWATCTNLMVFSEMKIKVGLQATLWSLSLCLCSSYSLCRSCSGSYHSASFNWSTFARGWRRWSGLGARAIECAGLALCSRLRRGSPRLKTTSFRISMR